MENSIDLPTILQLGTARSILQIALEPALCTGALAYLEKNASKLSLADEIERLRSLRDAHKLDKDTIFESPIWEGFGVREPDY